MSLVNAKTIMVDAVKKITGFDNLIVLDGQGTMLESIPDKSIGIAFVEEIDSISNYVLKIRLTGKKSVRSLPIIFFGYKSWKSLIRSEEKPKLLASEGVYYLELPASVEKIKSTVEIARSLSIADPMEAVKNSILSPEEQTKEESVIIHSLGNFFGSERLLYSAYLYRGFTFEVFQNEAAKIGELQEEFCGEHHKIDYAIYKLRKPEYSPAKKTSKGSTKDIIIKGNVLIIDDFAHLGWSIAIAYSLWGSNANKIERNVKDGLITDELVAGDSNIYSKIYSISRDKDTDEDEFVEKLEKRLTTSFINEFDIIVLDLRLKWKKDENIDDPSNTSGSKVLQKIRDNNAAIPVIIFTASRQSRNMENVFNQGADDYFIKEYTSAYRHEEEYSKAFIRKVRNALDRSFLGVAWPVIKHIESSCVINNERDEITYINKALALLKKRLLNFEQNKLGLNFINEAIIVLGDVNELKRKRNSVRESFDNGYLLGGLRNLAAHPSGEKLDLNDAKIALYLLFRLYTKDEAVLGEYVSRTFGDEIKEEPHVILFESCLRLLKNETDFDCLNTSLETDKSTNDKLLHYLYFLCRLKSPSSNMLRYDQYGRCDKIVLSYIFGKIRDKKEKISTELTGTIQSKGRQYVINPANYKGEIINIPDLDKSIEKDLLSGKIVKIKFELKWIKSNIGAINVKRI